MRHPSLLACLVASSRWGRTAAAARGGATATTTTAAANLAFASCPPPRFDAFADKLVGKWRPSRGGKAAEVEEVMRSCGGAVQGVRELGLLSSEGGSGGPYHNRADDGFVYFDCGSYGSGPVRLDVASNDGVGNVLMASLSFLSTPKRRVLVSTRLDCGGDAANAGPTCRYSRYAALVRPAWGEPDLEEGGASGLASVEDCLDLEPGSIRWERNVVCRMASPSQPWLLQRARWEEFLAPSDRDVDGESSEGDDAVEDEPRSDLLEGWAAASAWDGDSIDMLPDVLGSAGGGDGGAVVQMGALCRATNRALAVLRAYGGDGGLGCVALREGTLLW